MHQMMMMYAIITSNYEHVKREVVTAKDEGRHKWVLDLEGRVWGLDRGGSLLHYMYFELQVGAARGLGKRCVKSMMTKIRD